MINNSNSVPLMSFWPQVFDRIIRGDKLLEYRRVFPKNCNSAFMYISSPTKAICGIIYFEEVLHLDKLIGKFDKNVDRRIIDYTKKYHYAGTIKSIQKIKPITLEQLRNNIPQFTAPQSYLYLHNYPELQDFIYRNLVPEGDLIVNNLDNLLPNYICL